MNRLPTSSDNERLVPQGRRRFLSGSFLVGSSLLLAAESRGGTVLSPADDVDIIKTVGLADSITLYASLLEDARRLILQKDAQMIYVAKYEATEWLGHTRTRANQLKLLLRQKEPLSDQQKNSLSDFLGEVDYGGQQISQGLIRMRHEPLEQIKNLDADFDEIRAELGTASAALKKGDAKAARKSIEAALERLKRYGGVLSTPSVAGPVTGTEQMGAAQTNIGPYRPVEVPASSLAQLLQIVLELLNSPASGSRPRPQHHTKSTYGITVEPALQASINSILRGKLRPGTWLQIAIGYAVAFPILLRVGDHNNRRKLLNDALRVVPPGLRDPLLAELAGDLSNLP